ncbi:MAG: ABC transporter permease subunit, partial [Acidimicrobiales bacterium]
LRGPGDRVGAAAERPAATAVDRSRGVNRLLTDERRTIGLVAAGCVVLPLLTADAMPSLLPDSTALTLSIGVALAVAALSLNVLLGYAGQLSLGHAALLGVGACSASVAVDRWELPMPAGWALGTAGGAAIALVIGLPALRLRGLYLGLVTLAFGLTLQASLLRWQFFTRGSAGVSLPRRLWGDRVLTDAAPYLSISLLLLLAVWLLDRNVVRTKVGRAFQVLRDDEDAAESFGIDVVRYKLLAFVLAGGIAGLAGAMYGSAIGLVNSDAFTLDLSLRIVLFVVIGGIGTRWGPVAVALLLAITPQLPSSFRGWDLIVAGAITLYNVVAMPEGFAGLVRTRRRHRSEQRAAASDDDTLALRPDFVVVAPSDPADRAPGAELLTVHEVSVRFGGLHAVDGVSLRVEQGTIVGIIGPNGAGKSTLFDAITGYVPSARGQVVLDGSHLEGQPPHRRARAGLGRTFQGVGLSRDMTVRQNVLMAQHASARYGVAAALVFAAPVRQVEAELAERADEIIDRLGFSAYADTEVGSLSGGQQRLVELACVLSTAPRVLLLDEPTAGLAPAAAETLADRLRELRDDHGQSILLIEHNVPLVLDLCDQVYVLNAGQVLAAGTPASIGDNPEVLEAYLGGVLL